MDQPYSRIADSLLDYQYWSPNDPQRTPYDDTGWTFPELFNVQAVRVTDVKVLDAPIEKVTGEVRAKGEVAGTGSVFAVNQTTGSLTQVTGHEMAWTAVSLGGVVLVILGSSGTPVWSWRGDLLAVGLAITWAAYSVAVAPLMRSYSPYRISSIVLLLMWI